MALLIQEHLRTFNCNLRDGVDSLKEKFAIDAKWSEKYPELVLFKYDQISSPMSHPLVQEARGIILNSQDNWSVVAFPFTKFFNYGEGHAAKIDWSTARVQEKVDGSLCTVYYYQGKWNVATSGNPDAAGNVNDFDMTFGDLFWKTFETKGFSLDKLARDHTYMFELTSPYNRVVVPHKETNLQLIGVRCLYESALFGTEKCVSDYPEFNPVREYSLTSMDDVLKSFETFEGLNQEGYVVVDSKFNRVKVKHPGYVALHHMRDSLGNSRKSLVKLVVANEGDEFLSYFPEYKDDYWDIQADYNRLTDGLDEEFSIIFEAANGLRKDFALQAVKTRIPGYMFARLDGKTSNVVEYVKNLPIEGVMRLLGYRE